MILALIQVEKCDGCGEVESFDLLKEEIGEFADRKNWFVGLACDFCPNCKDTEAAKNRIRAEESAMQELSPMEEYAH